MYASNPLIEELTIESPFDFPSTACFKPVTKSLAVTGAYSSPSAVTHLASLRIL